MRWDEGMEDEQERVDTVRECDKDETKMNEALGKNPDDDDKMKRDDNNKTKECDKDDTKKRTMKRRMRRSVTINGWRMKKEWTR